MDLDHQPGRPGPWRIATRRSALARSQAQSVADALATATQRPAELVPLATTGDERPDLAIASFDTKGLFVDGVREAVLEGRADCAVHSYKDLPSERFPGLLVGAVPEREDPRDLLVTRDGHRLANLIRGGSVGTSSARRRAQIQRARRDLLVQPLRGNLDTRLRRVAEGEIDAVVVALAGVRRVSPIDLPLQAVPLEHGECLHAPAQGALAVECREDDPDTLEAVRAIDHAATRLLVRAERALLARLQAGCTAPVGAHASFLGSDHAPDATIELLGLVADPSGIHLFRGSHQASASEPEQLGRTLAEALLGQGAQQILEELREHGRGVPMGGP